MSDLNFRHNESMRSLLECVEKLRGPQGCPWDIEQTHSSLIPYALDEAYELVEVIQTQPLEDEKLKDELGDVLFQVLIHSQIASERGKFQFIDVMDQLREKLIRRHPHVFQYQGPVTKDEVLKNWEIIKAEEKSRAGEKTTSQAKIFKTPKYFSSLQKAQSIGKKTEELQFDWPDAEPVLEKVFEEAQELKEGFEKGDSKNIREEIGDLFFVLSQLCRKLNLDAETVAQEANTKFTQRFQDMISLHQKNQKISEANSLSEFTKLPVDDKEKLWEDVKKQNNQ